MIGVAVDPAKGEHKMGVIAKASIYLMANGTGNGAAYRWPGGEGVFQAEWTGGAGVTLQMLGPKPGSTTWLAVGTDTTLTVSGSGGIFALPANTYIRCAAGANTATYAKAQKLSSD